MSTPQSAPQSPPPPAPVPPNLDELISDLRALRLHGLVRLRHLQLDALGRAAALFGAGRRPPAALPPPALAEKLLRAAVDAIGPGNLGAAAQFTFGLAQGTRDWPAQDRRRRAAEVYGVSVERFRKFQETVLVEQVAEQILLCCVPSDPEPGSGPAAGSYSDSGRTMVSAASSPPASVSSSTSAPLSPAASGPESSSPVSTSIPGSGRGFGPARSTGSALDPALAARFAELGPGDRVVLEYPIDGAAPTVVVDLFPIELIRDVDVQVSPSNVYFEIPRIFGDTASAGLRRAAARHDAAGRITDDVVQRELAGWVAGHGGPGIPVRAGTAAPTSAGALADQGVRRIYHVAVAVPGTAPGGYVVDEQAVVEAVRGVFALGRQERADFDPPLASLCFPLVGSGRGGMRPETSVKMLWWSLREELRRDPTWAVHLAIQQYALAPMLLNHLLSDGARLAG